PASPKPAMCRHCRKTNPGVCTIRSAALSRLILAGKSTFPAAPRGFASPWNATCSIAIWDAPGRPRYPTTSRTTRLGRTSAVPPSMTGAISMSSIREEMGMNSELKSYLRVLALAVAIAFGAQAQMPTSLKGLMYVGTLDKKLLVISEDDGNIVGEIQLDGIPRVTVLSADKTKLHIITTSMQLDTVDLAARKVISSFPLSDGKSLPRMLRGAGGRNFSGLAVDPGGRYLYTTVKVSVKEIDQYRNDPPVFVKVDLQDQKIVQTIPFPKAYDQGFGFAATYKISLDGKLLYVL